MLLGVRPWQVGGVLLVTGLGFLPLAHLLLASTAFTALGVGLVVIGVTALLLDQTTVRSPTEFSMLMLETGVENLGALVEELGIDSSAFYLPSSVTGDEPMALLPIQTKPHYPGITRFAGRRLIVRYGPDRDEVGVLLKTPGSRVLHFLDSNPEPTPTDLEQGLKAILVGALDIAGGVTVNSDGQQLWVIVDHPRLQHRNLALYRAIGSPLASIIASVVAEAFDAAVVIREDIKRDGAAIVKLEVQNGTH
jgi:hypothetical protein